jgi:hypothetical protein
MKTKPPPMLHTYGIRLSLEEACRAEDLALHARFPTTRTAVLRSAVLIGLAQLESEANDAAR